MKVSTSELFGFPADVQAELLEEWGWGRVSTYGGKRGNIQLPMNPRHALPDSCPQDVCLISRLTLYLKATNPSSPKTQSPTSPQ